MKNAASLRPARLSICSGDVLTSRWGEPLRITLLGQESLAKVHCARVFLAAAARPLQVLLLSLPFHVGFPLGRRHCAFDGPEGSSFP
jgi:hypothetical protein